MEIKLMQIYPQDAVKMLQNNPGNRAISERVVRGYAKTMREKKWQINGDAISFNSKNELVNGQHRLSACVKSNEPFWTYVIYGNDATTFDTQARRTSANIMQLMGADNKLATNYTIALVKAHCFLTMHDAPTNDYIYNYLTENSEDILETIAICNKGANSAISRKAYILAACFHALKCGVPKEVLYKFFTAVNSGFSDSKLYSPAIVLRNAIINKSFSSHATDQIELYHFTCMAINDFSNGVPRSKNYKIDKEKTPYLQKIKAIEGSD